MEMKRALVWYLVIVVVLAGGLYLGLEMFVNNPDNPKSSVPESANLSGTESGPADRETSAGRTGGAVPAADNGRGVSSRGNPEAGPEVLPGSSSPVSTPKESAAVREGSGSASTVPAVTRSARAGTFTVQVAAFATRAKAAGVVTKLKNDGFSAGRIGGDLGDSLHRVWVGSFATRAEAAAMAERLKGKGYNTYVRAVL
jgi:cell division protein FtsN